MTDFPALEGRTVTEAHAKVCAERGHATHIVDNREQDHCPRCGDVLTWGGEVLPADPAYDECQHCRVGITKGTDGLWASTEGYPCHASPVTGKHAPSLTAHLGEDEDDYVARLANIVTPTVLAGAKAAYGEDLPVDAVPLMILLTMSEKIAALGGPVATPDDIDVYSLVYRTPNGSVIINNDEMHYENGHVSVASYSGTDWADLGEAHSDVVEFSNLDAAAVKAVELIKAHQ